MGLRTPAIRSVALLRQEVPDEQEQDPYCEQDRKQEDHHRADRAGLVAELRRLIVQGVVQRDDHDEEDDEPDDDVDPMRDGHPRIPEAELVPRLRVEVVIVDFLQKHSPPAPTVRYGPGSARGLMSSFAQLPLPLILDELVDLGPEDTDGHVWRGRQLEGLRNDPEPGAQREPVVGCFFAQERLRLRIQSNVDPYQSQTRSHLPNIRLKSSYGGLGTLLRS